jgi:hypothetical protein
MTIESLLGTSKGELKGFTLERFTQSRGVQVEKPWEAWQWRHMHGYIIMPC